MNNKGDAHNMIKNNDKSIVLGIDIGGTTCKCGVFTTDGELLYKNPEMLCDDDTFKKGTGIVNSSIENKTDIKLVVFDILPIEEFRTHSTKTPYSVRFEQLNELERKIKEYG